MVNIYSEAQLREEGLFYFKGDLFATNVWISKYALKDKNGNFLEKDPGERLRKITKEIERIENKFPNPLSFREIFSLLGDFKYFIFGGSILFGLGNDQSFSSLGNCFFINNRIDSYGGIFNTEETMIQLMKRRGGVGITLEDLRPESSPVSNAARTSTGAVSFAHRFSNGTREVAQDGRRGALMISLDIRYPDSEKFIMLKDDPKDVTGANISLKVPDDFMKAVESDSDFYLTWPIQKKQPEINQILQYDKTYILDSGLHVKRVKAKKLWNLLIQQAHKNAEPGIMFWDKMTGDGPQDCYAKDGFETRGTNPCISGDALIKTNKGELTIPEIMELYKNEDIEVLSFNEITKEIEYKKIELAQKTKENANIIEIEMEDGKKLKLTPDHKVYTETRGWIEASKLNESDILISVIEAIKKTRIKKINVIKNEDVYDLTVRDNHNFFANNILVHNCSEIGLSDKDSCRLGSINLKSFVSAPFTEKAKVEWDMLEYVSRASQRFMDDIIELEEEKIHSILEKIKSDPIPESYKIVEIETWKGVLESLKKGRRTGIGILGLADMIAALGLKFGTKEASDLSEKVVKTIAINCYKESVNLAKERGSFPIWDPEKESCSPFIRRIISDNFTYSEYEDYIKHGRRNIASLAIAPTGSLSILGQTSSGIEPVFKIFYRRRRKINPGESGVKVSFVDQNGDSWEEYNIIHHTFIEWFINSEYSKTSPYSFFNSFEEFLFHMREMTEEEMNELVKLSPWAGAESHDIDYMGRVELQGRIQKWIDHSISSTINLPEKTPVSKVDEIYKWGWKHGLKGLTVYRDGSRSGVLLSNSENKKVEFSEHDAPKRPKELPADYYYAKAKGKEFAVIIGTWPETGRPYEIFAFENPPMSKNTKGKLIKVKKGHYKFVNGEFEIDNVHLAAENIEERALTLTASMLLRHGAPVKHVVNVIQKIDDNITSFSSAVRRYLSRYAPQEDISGESCPNCGEKLIWDGGCIKCSNDECGYSKCN